MSDDDREDTLCDVLHDMECDANDALDDIISELEATSSALAPRARRLRTVVRLMAALSHLTNRVSTREVQAAFGEPGEWGYTHPLGQSLFRRYQEQEPATEAAE